MRILHSGSAVRAAALLSAAVVATALPATAATIDSWNTTNVAVGATPADSDTGASIVYDRDATDPAAVTNGRILFTPPEAVSPGIKVVNDPYPDSGPSSLELDGCIMTSSAANCDSPFQSGKRIKQQMTDVGPVDLVFNITDNADINTYQVFHRLINATGQALSGFSIELGFGVGEEFVRADAAGGLTFSQLFSAQPTGSGIASTQFPFGLFGDAASNPNFSLDGFFANERAGLTLDLSNPTEIASNGSFGPYSTLFGPWLSGNMVPEGAFWDNDGDASTDALLMAWLREDGIWEARRDIFDLGTGVAETIAPVEYSSFDDLVASFLGSGFDPDQDIITAGAIEDLANLNVNFAIQLGGMDGATQITLRSTVFAAPSPVPLPAGGLLMLSAMGALAFARCRRA